MSGRVPYGLRRRVQRWAADHEPAIRNATDVVLDSAWLEDRRFVAACVVVVDHDVALIDWAEVAAFVGHDPGSAGDEQPVDRALPPATDADSLPGVAPAGPTRRQEASAAAMCPACTRDKAVLVRALRIARGGDASHPVPPG